MDCSSQTRVPSILEAKPIARIIIIIPSALNQDAEWLQAEVEVPSMGTSYLYNGKASHNHYYRNAVKYAQETIWDKNCTCEHLPGICSVEVCNTALRIWYDHCKPCMESLLRGIWIDCTPFHQDRGILCHGHNMIHAEVHLENSVSEGTARLQIVCHRRREADKLWERPREVSLEPTNAIDCPEEQALVDRLAKGKSSSHQTPNEATGAGHMDSVEKVTWRNQRNLSAALDTPAWNGRERGI